MSVQFILGDRPQQKRKKIIDNINELLNTDQDVRVLYLIPDNVKYETETMILEQFKQKQKDKKDSGMIRLQVFSFSRLAWYLLQNKSIYQQPQLTESGLSMLLRKVLQTEEENLTIFRGASQEEGFINRLVNLFSEMRNGKITADDLREIISSRLKDDQDTTDDFEYKMKDLSLIFEKYNQKLDGKYVEQEDLYIELIDYITNQKTTFKDTIIIVDHYEHFSAQEQELIITIAKFSKAMFISLTLNPHFISMTNDLNNIFYRSLNTYHQLREVFQKNKISVLNDIIFQENNNSKEINEEIKLLQDYWLESSQSITVKEVEKYQKQEYENIEIWAAEDKHTEIMHIATKIKQMVSSGKYRYKDFQIMSRDLENYNLNIQALFNENEIPFFIDQADTMSQHPILEFVMSLFYLKKRYYRLDDIFRFLRTELFIPKNELNIDQFSENEEDQEVVIKAYKEAARSWRNKVDMAENVALAHGYQGNDWIDGRDWVYGHFSLEEQFEQTEYEEEILRYADDVKEIFKEYIVPFIDELNEMNTNREVVELLYNFIVDNRIINQLQYWRNQLNIQGELEEARKHEQAWENFILLLDEFVEILGDDLWDLDSFLEIIETGFEQATYSMVPPTIDQVLLTNYDLPKIQSQKVVFIIGLTDTQLPMIQSNQSLLTDEDREIVENSLSSEKYLAASEIESTAYEPFGFYLAILQAEGKIFFTYPLADGENGENRMSPYINRIRKAFSLIPKLKYANAISDRQISEEEYLEFIGSQIQSFGQLIISLRHALDHDLTPSTFWIKLFNQIYNSNNIIQNRILKSLTHKNIPVPLTEELTEELYGKDLYLSVSQLETFYADPYSHFLLYGLRLRERQVQELSPLESGNFYHDALDLISRQVITLKKDMAKITKAEIQKITKDVCQLLMDSNKYRLAQTSYRMNFIFNQLSKTIENLVWSMINQAKRSKFRPSKTELVFGQLGNQEGIPGLSLPINDSRKIHLRGKIDRIDTFYEDNQLYASIIDYKSSETTFDYQSIYYGLMLQMITYLDTVLTYSEEIFNEKANIIGTFYSTVKNPFIELQQAKMNNTEIELLKEYKLDGFINNQEKVLKAADLLLESGHSPLYPIFLSGNDEYRQHRMKRMFTEEEFDLLMRFNRDKIIKAGNEIIKGENMLQPFDKRELNVHTPSIDGPYRAISQFDAMLPENNYKKINKINREEFIQMLKEKFEDKEKGVDN